MVLIVDVVIDLISDTEGNDIEDSEFVGVSTVKKEALRGGEKTTFICACVNFETNNMHVCC